MVNLKEMVLIGSLMLAGGGYTGGSFGSNPKQADNYSERLNNFLGKQSELYIASELEKSLKKEKELSKENTIKELYLTPDLLNAYIKQAYKKAKVWPKEFDKRLFRLMLKQESEDNVYARSKTGYLGLGQIGSTAYETFRPEKYATFKDSADLEKELFNPVENLTLSLEHLNHISNFCEKKHPKWSTLNIDNKRKIILACYNAGMGKIQKVNWDIKSKKLKRENRNYPEEIMEAYYNQKVKVKV